MMEVTICYASLQLALTPRQDRGSRQHGAGWLRRAPWPHSGCRWLYSLDFSLFSWNIIRLEHRGCRDELPLWLAIFGERASPPGSGSQRNARHWYPQRWRGLETAASFTCERELSRPAVSLL